MVWLKRLQVRYNQWDGTVTPKEVRHLLPYSQQKQDARLAYLISNSSIHVSTAAAVLAGKCFTCLRTSVPPSIYQITS